MNKFYTAKNDKVFKAIMMRNQKILKAIIESILKIEIDEILILNSELPITYVRSKKRIVDLLIKSKDKYINVELNPSFKKEHVYRNLTYVFNIYSNKIQSGERYSSLMYSEFIGINLSYGLNKSKIKEEYKIQSNSNKEYVKNFKIIEIDMDKIRKDWYILSSEEKNEYKYLYMLDLNKEELKINVRGDRIMKEFEEEVNKINQDEQFKYFLTDEEDGENLYESGLIIAKNEGLEEASINIAKKLLQENITIDKIAEITNLPIEEIINLKTENK